MATVPLGVARRVGPTSRPRAVGHAPASRAPRGTVHGDSPNSETWQFNLSKSKIGNRKTTPVGFEPTRGDPIGLAGRRLSRSAKVSVPFCTVSSFICLLLSGGCPHGKIPDLRISSKSDPTLPTLTVDHLVDSILERKFLLGNARPCSGMCPRCQKFQTSKYRKIMTQRSQQLVCTISGTQLKK